MWRLSVVLLAHAALAFEWPPNPLGPDCLTIEFEALEEKGYDPTAIDVPGGHAFDPRNEPTFLDYARKSITGEWLRFKNSICRGRPNDYDRAGWAGNCRGIVSTFRDAVSIFAAVYPMGGVDTQYDDDKWEYISNLTHDCYHDTGDFLDQYLACKDGECNDPGANALKDETWARLHEWWDNWGHVMGFDGERKINAADKLSPTWDQYIRLDEQALIGPTQEQVNNFNVVYNHRWMTRQFWGYTNFAQKQYSCYSNIGYLMQTQLDTALGNDDGATGDLQWHKVLAFTDIATIDDPTSTDETVKYATHEQFHDLRKQLRSMWNTANDFPEILPIMWESTLIANMTPAKLNLWDVSNVNNARLANGASVKWLLFQNSEGSKRQLYENGWSEALIQMGTAMALGGFFVEKQDCSNEAACNANIDVNVVCDWPSRMGCINDLFMDFKVLNEAGTSPPAVLEDLRTRMNALWVRLKVWMEKNDMLNLQKTPGFYLPWRECGVPNDAPPTPPPEPTTPPPTHSPTLHLPPQASTLPIVVVNTGEFGEIPLADQNRAGPGTVEASIEIFGTYPVTGKVFTVDDTPAEFFTSLKDRVSPIMRAAAPKRMFQFGHIDRDTKDDDEAAMLDMPVGESWFLSGSFADNSLMRAPLAAELANSIGMWSPRVRAVELYLIEDRAAFPNFYNHYQGVYLLTERVKRDKQRVNVKKYTEGGEDFEDHGIILVNGRGKSKFINSPDGFVAGHFQLDYPTHDTHNATAWIVDYIQQFEAVLYADVVPVSEWRDEKDGYQKYMDVNSFVDWFLHTELCASIDAYASNTYMVYDGDKNKKGGHSKRLEMRAPFFFEYSMGNVGSYIHSDGGSWYPSGWRYEARVRAVNADPDLTPDVSQWYVRLMSDPWFKAQVVRRWATLRVMEWSDARIYQLMDRLKTELKPVQARNFEKWRPKDGRGLWEFEATQLETWVWARVKWLDEQLTPTGRMFHGTTAQGSTCDVPGTALLPQHPANFKSKATAPKVTDEGSGNGRSLLQWHPCPTDCDGTPEHGGPWDLYPQCASRMDWLIIGNWKRYKPEIDGTTCSMQEFLHRESPNFCPEACRPGCDTDDCLGPFDETRYPVCAEQMKWVMNNWESDPKFAEGGILNGTTCQVQRYLHFENATHPACPEPCLPPTPAPTFPPSTRAPTPLPEPSPPPTYRPDPPPAPAIDGPVAGLEGCAGECVGPWPGYPLCRETMRAWFAAMADSTTPEAQRVQQEGFQGTTCEIQRVISIDSPMVCPPPPPRDNLQCINEQCQDPSAPTVGPIPVDAPTPAAATGGASTVTVVFVVLAVVGVGAAVLAATMKRKFRGGRHVREDSRLEPLVSAHAVRSDGNLQEA